MHKKLIKRDAKYVPYLQGGTKGLFASVGGYFGKEGQFGNFFKGFSGGGANALSNTGISNTGTATGAAGAAKGIGVPTEGTMLNASIGGAVASGLQGINAFADINSSSMNKVQKTMARADAGVDAVAGIASNFGPYGQAISAGLQIVNNLGGKLMKVPKAVKDFGINDTVAQSSSFGGVNETASQAGAGADSFKTAGLAGKLAGKNRLLNSVNTANKQMNQSSQILNSNKQAIDSASASSDMFSARNNFKLNNNNAFMNGSVQFGQEGMVITKANPNKTVENYQKLGRAAKQIDVKKIKRNIKKAQQGLKLSQSSDFDKWYAQIAKYKNLDPDPYNKEHYYDYKLFFDKEPKLAKQLLTDDKDAHFTDIGKMPGHPTFSNESAYFNEGNKHLAGYWEGENFIKYDKIKQNLIKKNEDGGILETKNIIADGVLHAHKHTLKEIEEFADADITLKGIPVITKDADGGIIQHAEIEKDELILHLDLTKQLEELYEKEDEDSMIEAGKLLAKELIKNTIDSKSKIIKNG